MKDKMKHMVTVLEKLHTSSSRSSSAPLRAINAISLMMREDVTVQIGMKRIDHPSLKKFIGMLETIAERIDLAHVHTSIKELESIQKSMIGNTRLDV